VIEYIVKEENDVAVQKVDIFAFYDYNRIFKGSSNNPVLMPE
jgi:hypothetical protein